MVAETGGSLSRLGMYNLNFASFMRMNVKRSEQNKKTNPVGIGAKRRSLSRPQESSVALKFHSTFSLLLFNTTTGWCWLVRFRAHTVNNGIIKSVRVLKCLTEVIINVPEF